MKSIIINETNRERINAAIAEVEGRATARTITYDDVVRACAVIEKRLGIAKKDLEGVEYSVDIHAQTFPRAYKYRAESTQFHVKREGGKWRVTHVMRYYTRADGHDYKCITMPDATKQAIIMSKMKFA